MISSFLDEFERRSRLGRTRLVRGEVSFVRNLGLCVSCCGIKTFRMRVHDVLATDVRHIRPTYHRSMFLRSYVKLSTVVTGSSITSLLIWQQWSRGISNFGPVNSSWLICGTLGISAPGFHMRGSGEEDCLPRQVINQAHNRSLCFCSRRDRLRILFSSPSICCARIAYA